jgi:pimeloyl-ACP methyl ester carboxylesterase
MHRLAARLADASVDVVVPSLPGHGYSTASPSSTRR